MYRLYTVGNSCGWNISATYKSSHSYSITFNMSTIYTTDWIKFLGQDSELPPDVTFCVVQSTGTFKVRAHKLILAAVSPVFRKMFYGDQSFSKDD